MVHKIDYAATREAVRKSYAEFPTNGDGVLEFEARNAGLIADLAVMVIRECVENKTPIPLLIQAMSAMFSIPLENLANEYRIDKASLAAAMDEGMQHYLVAGNSVAEDAVKVERRNVGDA